jgi:hypothetical protein
MIEISVPITLGNEPARSFKREVKAFLAYVDDKMAGGRPDRHDTATQAYVAMRIILARVEQEIARQDARDQVAARPPRQPTIREQRGR